MYFTRCMVLASLVLLSACGDDDDGVAVADAAAAGPDGGAVTPDAEAGGEDLDMKATDFECVLRWDQVRNFRITNKHGHQAEALAVANNVNGGGAYPVGTIIQVVPFEAMVKRKHGWNAATNDWEFFNLQVSADGTVIPATNGRGADITNQAGSCKDCHAKAMPQYDLVCESGHGCDPLPFGSDVLLELQNADARCP
jgi:hypothetical protein